MSKAETLAAHRISDARRVRELWHRITQEQPAVPEDRRVGLVYEEAVKRAPSGAFLYLASFRTNPPSRVWVEKALRGLVGRERMGEPLLTPSRRRESAQRRRGPFSAKMDWCIESIQRLARDLGVELEPPPDGN